MENDGTLRPPVDTTLLSRTRIVLVETSHPGNIGAVARAMKTMGLSRLALVNPREFPSAAATARASGADDILMRAICHEDLAHAIADCGMVVGTTARSRHLEWPVGTPRQLALELSVLPDSTQCAIVFGREQSGLSNEELALCQRVIRIPTEETFSSLNIAHAVQICAYELRIASPRTRDPSSHCGAESSISALQALFSANLRQLKIKIAPPPRVITGTDSRNGA